MPFFETLGRPDPTRWLLASEEPAARWVALTRLQGLAADSLEAQSTHTAVTRDPGVRTLLDRLPDWETDNDVTGHDKPACGTNLLNVLGDMGLREGDDPRIARLLDQMLAHTDADGRFQMYGRERGEQTPKWGALECDTLAIADVLLRFGRGDNPVVRRALETALGDLAQTDQGLAWPCRPDTGSTWRGPGRAKDCCVQVTLEGLRAFSRLPREERPPALAEVARTSLGVWRERGVTKPYMFGHGRQFKQVKWPPTWYGAYAVVDTMGRLPEVWSEDDAGRGDRRALAEIAACLVAYNASPDGTVTPLSTFKGFESYSFGQKKDPSPFATAMLWSVLKRLESLAGEIAAIDVMKLGSSKGGDGTPMPPKVPA